MLIFFFNYEVLTNFTIYLFGYSVFLFIERYELFEHCIFTKNFFYAHNIQRIRPLFVLDINYKQKTTMIKNPFPDPGCAIVSDLSGKGLSLIIHFVSNPFNSLQRATNDAAF